MLSRTTLHTITAIALTAGLSASVQAAPVTFSGALGSLAAQVTFDVSGNQLLVHLVNTSSADPSAPGDILSGVIFSIGGNPLLTKTSAILAAGSSVLHGPATPTGPGGSVAGEWAYTNALTGAFVGQSAIYSSGYFDGNARFDTTTNLQGPGSVDGIQYGITTLSDLPGNDNGGLSGGLISNAVDFILTGLAPGFDLASIRNVSFQYGTSLTETNIPGGCVGLCSPDPRGNELPEPSSIALLAASLLGCSFFARRKHGKMTDSV